MLDRIPVLPWRDTYTLAAGNDERKIDCDTQEHRLGDTVAIDGTDYEVVSVFATNGVRAWKRSLWGIPHWP